MRRYFNIIGFTILLLFNLCPLNFAQEQITITAYYPSPYGRYRELRSERMTVSPNRAMPGTDGLLAWGDYRGLLSTDQGASIELGGTGTPYIDFSNDMGSDFDARISLLNDSNFRIYAGQLELRNQGNSNWADIRIKCLEYHSSLINPVSPFSGTICEADLQIVN